MPPACVLTTSIPVGFSPHLKTEGNVFSSSFFSVLLVVTEKKVCGEYVKFHQKKACSVVLNQAFLRVLTFQPVDVEIFCLFW